MAAPSCPDPKAQSRPRSYNRAPRIARNAIVVARRLVPMDGSWIRVDLIDSSDEGLGLRTLVPLRTGAHMALSITAGTVSELLRCSVRHCTKLNTGYYDVGVKILERIPGHLNTTPIPGNWWERSPQTADS